MYVPSRSPTATAARPLAKVATPHVSRAAKIAQAEALVEKLGDLRAGLPVRKLKDGSAAHLDRAIVLLSEYLDLAKGGGR